MVTGSCTQDERGMCTRFYTQGGVMRCRAGHESCTFPCGSYAAPIVVVPAPLGPDTRAPRESMYFRFRQDAVKLRMGHRAAKRWAWKRYERWLGKQNRRTRLEERELLAEITR